MANYDLLVDLNQVNFSFETEVSIKRVLSPDADEVVDFITTNFSKKWASEAKAALYKVHSSCFIAVMDKKVIGFACYDATAKGFFGPIGVDETIRGKNIGKALLLKSLEGMKYEGYQYAIIGGVSDRVSEFYAKSCGSIKIENSAKVYLNMISK
ncbi:MAG TPA: GNAT family N-acetyltransferase [Acholeplasma sp.]|nr:GNAT family N-acetyltransferase [Acholeplasma sp.]